MTEFYPDFKLIKNYHNRHLSKRAFIEMLGKYGISVFSTSVLDLHSDIANA